HEVPFMDKCKACGESLPPGTLFCATCGLRQNSNEATAPDNPTHLSLSKIPPINAPTPVVARKSRFTSRNTVLFLVIALALLGWGNFAYLRVILPSTITQVPLANPSSTPTLYLYTQAPLSDGRPSAWRYVLHGHRIEGRWVDYTSQWTPWGVSYYPPSGGGIQEITAYTTKDGITHLTVSLDDGTCWEQHKLSPSPDDGWTLFVQ